MNSIFFFYYADLGQVIRILERQLSKDAEFEMNSLTRLGNQQIRLEG